MTDDPAATPAAAPWRRQAACLGADPRLFTDPRPDTDDTHRALAICGPCPVQAACLTEALTRPAGADVGIWGATTEYTRHTMRRHAATPGRPSPPSVGLFPTLDGDLTDLTGRALVTQLPTAPRHLLLIDRRPRLRTDDLNEAWCHLTATLHELQPTVLAPFTLTDSGDLTEPSGRALITRLPVAPHLLIVLDGRPHTRTDRLDHARHRTLAALARARRPDPQQPPRPPAVTGVGAVERPGDDTVIAAHRRPAVSRR